MNDARQFSDPGRSETQMMILACVATLPGKLPRSGIAKLLVGSHSQRVLPYTRHPYFGRLDHLHRKIVTQEIDALLNRGDLALDYKSRITLNEEAL
jgi:hypothetical protein